jgi:hypothetical protein
MVKQIFKRIATLLNSADEHVRIEAGAGYEKLLKEYHLMKKEILI